MLRKKLYVAYGSNLNKTQMKYRCPNAEFVGTGTLRGYELQFKGARNYAYATIAPKPDSEVPVGVWKITPEDERNLNRYEGYPTHYFKQNIPVQMENGQTVKAMVYIMDLKQEFGMPSASYYNTVYAGYLDCDLDTDFLDDAIEQNRLKVKSCGYSESYYSSAGYSMNIFDGVTDDSNTADFNDDDEDYSEGMKLT